jgi:hypothetical protein
MSDSNFDLILQELLHQQEIMETLEAENRELRRQLADLREGRGIFIEIDGVRFALSCEAGTLPAESLPTAQMAAVISGQEETAVFAAQELSLNANQQSFLVEEPAQDTVEMPPTISEVPTTAMNFLLDDEPVTTFPFLQETIEEEASAIATSKMAIWGESPSTPFPPIPASQPDTEALPEQAQKPAQPARPALIDEDEKAALRRELIGSFLLE